MPLLTWNVMRFHLRPDYSPPLTRTELEQRYAAGERCFPETDLCEADLSGIKLDGVSFEKHSWFHSADFSGASLRGTSFRECNLKCANFSNCDLTGAILELAAICLLYTSPSPRDRQKSRMPSSA